MNKGSLYLIPNTLGGRGDAAFTPFTAELVADIDVFIVEEIRSARRWLRALGVTRPLEEVEFLLFNEHTKTDDLEGYMTALLNGQDVGLMSEAGLPCVADPGNEVVRLAHAKGITVVPLVGASSIMMALMSSGLNGQNFAFNGYLPKDKNERFKKIRQLEQMAITQNQTQLFMDAPYRNDSVLSDLIENCKPTTMLCIATDISMDSEVITTKTLGDWAKKKPPLHKRPVMFVLGR